MATKLRTKGKTAEPAGLTPQRQVVFQVVNQSADHPTASQVFEQARALLPTISYATVYNSLRFLKQAGLVQEISFGNAASRYDRETHRHDHAMCTQCGKLVDFDLSEAADLMRAAARRTHFKAESVRLTLTGVCPECRSS
jgi:Fur family peroxide stress response transcriptional regulator